jgi:hypothetical protein
MTDTDRRPGWGRALISSAALTGGLMVTGGALAAPAYATCSPQARPCITDVVMKDPTTLVFNWTDTYANVYQVRYHSTSDPDFLGLPGGSVIPDNQFEAFGTSWEIRDVKPGATYVLKVQACKPVVQSIFDTSCGDWTGWDERTFTVPTPQDAPGHTLGRRPVTGGDTPPQLEKQIDLPDFDGPVPNAPTATVAADVDVYTAKNEPAGAGQVEGILRQGGAVTLVGDCAPESWCEVSGDAVPGGHGWVWGHLNPT